MCVVRCGLEMREGVLGNSHMGGGHAVFKALAGKGHLSRPPGLAAVRSAKTKDQSLQFPVMRLHRIVSRNKVLDRSKSQRRLAWGAESALERTYATWMLVRQSDRD
jgi:hypothetical protein